MIFKLRLRLLNLGSRFPFVDGRADDEISENVAGARGVATLKVAGEVSVTGMTYYLMVVGW